MSNLNLILFLRWIALSSVTCNRYSAIVKIIIVVKFRSQNIIFIIDWRSLKSEIISLLIYMLLIVLIYLLSIHIIFLIIFIIDITVFINIICIEVIIAYYNYCRYYIIIAILAISFMIVYYRQARLRWSTSINGFRF